MISTVAAEQLESRTNFYGNGGKEHRPVHPSGSQSASTCRETQSGVANMLESDNR